jgi:hypothetical protein
MFRQRGRGEESLNHASSLDIQIKDGAAKDRSSRQFRARIFKLLRTPGIDSTESIPCENQFHLGIDSWEGGGDDGGPEN